MATKQGLAIRVVHVAMVAALTVIRSTAWAAEQEPVDTSHWNCRFCAFPGGWVGNMRGGIGYVSEDAAKFGEHSDLDEQGLYPVIGGTASYYGEDASRWDLIARDLGLDTRYLSLEGGRQGIYELSLTYDGLVHHVSDTGQTPYRGLGGEHLRLPAGWTRASATGGMSDLPASLRDLDIGTERRRFDLNLGLRQSDRWSYTFDVRHEERDGRRLTGGTFITSAAQLPAEIDYRTDTVELGARYQADDWQLGIAYRASLFRNDKEALVWDNAYSMPGPDQGRSATAPDNQAHQLSLSASYRIGAKAFFVGDLSVGHMRQDEDLLPATINPGIETPALPRDSAEAEVNTLSSNGRLTYRTSLPRLSLVFDYHFNRRDNDTPRDVFTQVVTDSFAGADRRNEPIGYDRFRSGLKASYRLRGRGRVSTGIDYERFARDFGDDPTTDEHVLWAEYRTRVGEKVQTHFKLSRAGRSGDSQGPDSAAPSPQNPRMTWFNLADRTRLALDAGVHVAPTERTAVGISGSLADEDYDDSVIGRTGVERATLSVDLSARPRDDTTLYAYVGHERYATDQANSQGFGAADWRGETKDAFVSAGAGGRITGIKGKLDLAVDLIYADSTGEVEVTAGGGNPGFPDLETRRLMARLTGDYRVRDNLSFGLGLAYERFRSDAFFLDGVHPATGDRLLALGEQSPSYNVLTTMLSVEYGF